MSVEKVIMVAQEEFLRKQVAQYLRKKRIDVAECGTIQEAHDFMGKGNFDLMLLDESLPDGSGAEFLAEVNLRPAKPMVVMMGAEGSVDIAVQCMRDGAFDYLIKPFKRIALLDILARHLKLTWRHRAPEHTPPGPHVTPPRSISTATLHDEALRDELIALAEVGHLSGLRDKIHRIREAGLLDETSAYALDSALERFDFRELIRLLDMPS